MIRPLFLLAILVLTSEAAIAQSKPVEKLPDPFAIAGKSFGDGKKAGNYLAPLLDLYPLHPEFAGKPEIGLYDQALATYQSFVNGEDSAWYFFYGRKKRAGQPFVGARSTAYKQISSKLNRQFLLFSESHTQPKCRAYVNSWLPKLYEQGYRYLAMEALDEDSVLMKRGLPTLASGFYVREPQMADLIRTALRLGFKLVAYDSELPDREQAQARNIIRKTVARDPAAKVVVLAGHAHIDEDSTHQKSMAVWLHKLTGMDPLTIDQTRAEPYTVTTGEGEVALIPPASYPWPKEQGGIKADIYVLNELQTFDNGNMYGGPSGGPISVFLPDTVLNQDWCQVQILLKEELEKVPNAVPVYVRLLKGEHGKLTPYLAYGLYKLLVRDRSNRVIWDKEIDHQPPSEGR